MRTFNHVMFSIGIMSLMMGLSSLTLADPSSQWRHNGQSRLDNPSNNSHYGGYQSNRAHSRQNVERSHQSYIQHLNEQRNQSHRDFDRRMRELDREGQDIDHWQSEQYRHSRNHQRIADLANQKRDRLNRKRDQLNRERDRMNRTFDRDIREAESRHRELMRRYN